MPDGQNYHGIIVDPVSDDIAAVAEVDEPFPERLGEVLSRSAKAGMRA